jgi:hypothetical protein
MELNFKKGFLPRDFLIGIILFSLVIVLVVIGAQSFGSEYGVTMVNPEFSNRYDAYINMTTTAAQMFNSTASGSGLTLVGTFNSIFSGTFTVISLICQSVGLAVVSMANVFGDFNVPTEVYVPVGAAVISIISIIIVLSIIGLLARGRI